jgi:hypothetical protein
MADEEELHEHAKTSYKNTSKASVIIVCFGLLLFLFPGIHFVHVLASTR